jgi:hypothetical protein
MTLLGTPRFFALLLIVATAATLQAQQLPKDNDVWKTRCALLASYDNAIQTGAMPPALVSATRGVAGEKFAILATERSQDTQHNVACTMFYLAAISVRAGNGPKLTPKLQAKAVKNYSLLGHYEFEVAHGQKPQMTERMKRASIKAKNFGTPLTLNADESGMVIAAATTMPLSVSPTSTAAMPPTTGHGATTKKIN